MSPSSPFKVPPATTDVYVMYKLSQFHFSSGNDILGMSWIYVELTLSQWRKIIMVSIRSFQIHFIHLNGLNQLFWWIINFLIHSFFLFRLWSWTDVSSYWRRRTRSAPSERWFSTPPPWRSGSSIPGSGSGVRTARNPMTRSYTVILTRNISILSTDCNTR